MVFHFIEIALILINKVILYIYSTDNSILINYYSFSGENHAQNFLYS